MSPMLAIDDARKELSRNTLLDIERATAKTWGSRAAAAYTFARESSGDRRSQWLSDAENYRQESLEHAAMTEDIAFLESIIEELDVVREGLPVETPLTA